MIVTVFISCHILRCILNIAEFFDRLLPEGLKLRKWIQIKDKLHIGMDKIGGNSIFRSVNDLSTILISLNSSISFVVYIQKDSR